MKESGVWPRIQAVNLNNHYDAQSAYYLNLLGLPPKPFALARTFGLLLMNQRHTGEMYARTIAPAS